MARNIWVVLTEDIEAQLASEGCQEYKRLSEEISNEYSELSDDDQYDFSRLTPSEEKLEQFFNGLSKSEQKAIEMEFEIEETNNNINYAVYNSWKRNKWSSYIIDVESEEKYIEAMQKKYVYPDLVDVIGHAATEDFVETIDYFSSRQIRDLTTERKADLMLFGVFEWNNLFIAKAYKTDEKAPRGWQICVDPDYIPRNVLGPRYIAGRTFRDQLVFMPFHGFKTEWLSEFLLECDIEIGNRQPKAKFQRLKYIDGNPYNCLPENLALVENRGRRMVCSSCGKPVTVGTSRVIRDGPAKFRYCRSCLGEE